MLKPIRLVSCGLVAAAIAAGGCGSSKTGSTPKTASASAAATGPTTSQATHSTSVKQAPQTSKAHTQTPAASTPSGQTTASKKSAAVPLLKAKPEPKAPPKGGKYEYPLEAQRNFLEACEGARSTKSSCECIIEKYARRRVEEGQSLAELLATEVALKNATRLNRRSRQYARECKSTIR
jgi:hypothetical protein